MDPMFPILNGDQDNEGLIGEMDLLTTLGKNPESLINGSQMNPDFQYEMDDFLRSLMSTDEPEQKGTNLINGSTSRQKDILSENTKLKMFIKRLKLKNIEQESQLADYETKLAEKMKTLNTTERELEIVKEKLQAFETENFNLQTQAGQLQVLVNQYKHLNFETDDADKNYSALETKLKKAKGYIQTLKSKLTKYKGNGSDPKTTNDRQEAQQSEESLKLKLHIKMLWKLITERRGKAGLTIKEKEKLIKECKEWFPSEDTSLQFEGGKENAVDILHDLPSNLLEVVTTPKDFVKIPSSSDNQETNEETNLTLSTYSMPDLLSSDQKVSSSDDSPTKTVQHLPSIPDLKSETMCHKKVTALDAPSYPCSPDSLSLQDDTNACLTGSPTVSLDQQQSPTGMVPSAKSSLIQPLTDTSDFSCFTLLSPDEVPSTCDQVQESLGQNSSVVVGTNPPSDIQDSLCNITPLTETVESFSGEMSNEKESNEASVSDWEFTDSINEDLTFSDDSIDAPDVLEELNKQIPFESELFMKNQADSQSLSDDNKFETSQKHFRPIFSVPKLISPLPVTPPNTCEKKESKEKSSETATEISSNKAMKKIEFRFVCDNLTSIQNNSLDNSPKHLTCNLSQSCNAIIEQSCFPINSNCNDSEDLEFKKTRDNDSATFKTSIKLASNQMNPDNSKNFSHLESPTENSFKSAVELLCVSENNSQEINFEDTLQKKMNPIKSHENKSVPLIPEPSIKISQRNKFEVVEQNDSELLNLPHQHKLACISSSKNIQLPDAENFQSKKKQKIILSAEISNSVPLRVRGRTLLNRGVLKKRKIETVANDEAKLQTDLEKDQMFRANSTKTDESLTYSDYSVVGKPKKVRLEHKKNIASLSTSNFHNVTVNTDETALVTSGMNIADDNTKNLIKSDGNNCEVSFTSSYKNVQPSQPKYVESKKRPRIVLNEEIYNSVPVRVRGRTLLNRGILKKHNIDTEADDDVKKQTELSDQVVKTKLPINNEGSLTQSDLTVAGKPEQIRMEPEKNIASLLTSISNNLTVNADKTKLVTSAVKDSDNSCKENIAEKLTSVEKETFKEKYTNVVSHVDIKNKTSKVIALLNLFPSKTKEIVPSVSASFIENEESISCKSVAPTCIEDLIASSLSNKNSKCSRVMFSDPQSSLNETKEQEKKDKFLLSVPKTTDKTQEKEIKICNENDVSVPMCQSNFVNDNFKSKIIQNSFVSVDNMSQISDDGTSRQHLKPTISKIDKYAPQIDGSTDKTQEKEIKICNENDANVPVGKSNFINNNFKSKINQNSFVSVHNMSKISDDGISRHHLKPTISKVDNYAPQIGNCVKKFQNGNYALANKFSNNKKIFFNNRNKSIEYKLPKCDEKKVLGSGLEKKSSVLNREHSGLETQSCSKKITFARTARARKMKNKMLKKDNCKAPENRLEKFFRDSHEIQSSTNFNYVQSLVELLTNQDNIPNHTVLLFHTLNYLVNSKTNPLHIFSLNQDSSVLLPFEENCIVTALYSIESKHLPALDGLLRTAITAINHLILAKEFAMLGLASLCRVFTEICKRENDSLKPVLLCGDLLKMKHHYAPFLIACVAGVWKELFQIEDSLPAEEKLLHSSILYGACKKTKKLTELNWKCSNVIISKYFTAPPVKDARSAIQILKNFIEIKCQNDSWNNQYMTSALIILAVYEDWDWIKMNLLDSYIAPNLTKFGCKALNRVAFDMYCNLFVDIWFLKNGDLSYENYLSNNFIDPEVWKGATFVSECVALALIKLLCMKNKSLPPFLTSWLQRNQQNPILQTIEPSFSRRLMKENKSELLLKDCSSLTVNIVLPGMPETLCL